MIMKLLQMIVMVTAKKLLIQLAQLMRQRDTLLRKLLQPVAQVWVLAAKVRIADAVIGWGAIELLVRQPREGLLGEILIVI